MANMDLDIVLQDLNRRFAAMFPTVTKFGMAALLPHNVLGVVEKKRRWSASAG